MSTSSTKDTTTASTTNPWGPQAGPLTSAFTNAGNAYNTASTAVAPTNFTAQMTPDQLCELRRWRENEYRATLADRRRTLCNPTDLLEIRIPTILCESCFCAKVDGILVLYRGADVLTESWKSDLANILDEVHIIAIRRKGERGNRRRDVRQDFGVGWA